MRLFHPVVTAYAHCDLPCGVYDPAQARIECALRNQSSPSHPHRPREQLGAARNVVRTGRCIARRYAQDRAVRQLLHGRQERTARQLRRRGIGDLRRQ